MYTERDSVTILNLMEKVLQRWNGVQGPDAAFWIVCRGLEILRGRTGFLDVTCTFGEKVEVR